MRAELDELIQRINDFEDTGLNETGERTTLEKLEAIHADRIRLSRQLAEVTAERAAAEKKLDDELCKWLVAVRKAAGLEAYIVPQTGLLEELSELAERVRVLTEGE